MNQVKAFNIPKQLVMNAWILVKKNAGSAGIDKESISDFEGNLKDNLYKIWNRMSSGSYMPPVVKGVNIPKKSGGTRLLGIPTVGDRVAQATVKLMIEPALEKIFLPDSYGYRPNKSAHDALEVTRRRCWKYDWILEFDICGLFDNINHELLMKAVHHHVKERWCVLYIERWIKVGIVTSDGAFKARENGTPQGGVISPILSNLFLHYAFDRWMSIRYPDVPWCRYADDGLLHCRSREQAEFILKEISKRFEECGLKIHPEKTKIAYCKDANRKENHLNNEFTFLGYTFKSRLAMNNKGQFFMSFIPAISDKAMKLIKYKIKHEWKLDHKTNLELIELATKINPIIRGWYHYYGKFYKSKMQKISRYINDKICKWFRRKYLGGNISLTKSFEWIKRVYKANNRLFEHWKDWKFV